MLSQCYGLIYSCYAYFNNVGEVILLCLLLVHAGYPLFPRNYFIKNTVCFQFEIFFTSQILKYLPQHQHMIYFELFFDIFNFYLVNLTRHFCNGVTNVVFTVFATPLQRSNPNNHRTEIIKTSEDQVNT